MFVFDPDLLFEWPVKVAVPGEDAPRVFTGLFRYPDDEKEIFERLEGADTAAMIDASRARLARYFVGWRGIEVKEGGELDFTEERRDRLLSNRSIRLAVDEALFEALIGIREKN